MRIRLLQRLILSGLLAIWVGLFSTQVLHGPIYRDKAERNRTRLVHLPAARGSILDRRGIPLAEDRLHFELAILPQELQNPGETWRHLSWRVGIPAEELARRYKKGFYARFAPVTVVRDLKRETAFLLEEERAQLPGILVRPVPRRRYPLGSSGGSAIGYLGLIAPEELTKLEAYGYTLRDWVGKDGIEKVYDGILRGRDGGLHMEVNAQGKMVQQIGFLPPQRGHNLFLTVDSRLQELCYRLLEESRGALIVMNSTTGEILALVSSPSFDPQLFVDSRRSEEVRRILKDPERPFFNRAIRAMVPPGSIFKAAVAYQALREDKITPGTAFECKGQYKLGRATFRCWREEGHSFQTVSEALEHSCNVFFYNTGRRLGVEGIARAARLFRLDCPTGIDLPWEAKGLVPDAAWMKHVHRQSWREGDTLSFGIGQGALQVTPMEMLMLFNAIATNGDFPRPLLVLRAEGQDLPSRPPSGVRIPLEAAALSRVKTGLERVVQSETGTGQLAQVAGIRIAGKTGTAQVSQGLPHAWFCGYAPAEHPKVSFVVFLEHGGKGGLRPAQIAGQLVATLKEMEYL